MSVRLYLSTFSQTIPRAVLMPFRRRSAARHLHVRLALLLDGFLSSALLTLSCYSPTVGEAIQKYSEAMDADPDNETIKAVLLSNRAAAYLRVRRLGPSSSMAGSLVGSGAAPLSRRNLC